MNHRILPAAIVLAGGLALLTAGCVSTLSRAEPAEAFHSYAIVADDDRGPLSPADLARVQIGLVQFLVSQGYVHPGQVFTPDFQQADVVFRITIAWQGADNRFAVVAVTPAYGGSPGAAAPGGQPPAAYDGAPYDPWADDYDEYPDFGYSDAPYFPWIGIAPFVPIFDHAHYGRPAHPGDRSGHHRPSGRDDDRRRRDPSVRRGDHPPFPALPPRPARRPEGDGHRPPLPPRRSWSPGPDRRPPPANSPDRHPDGPRTDHRPPPSRPPDRNTHRPPPGRPGPPPAAARPPTPDRPNHPSPRDSSVGQHPPRGTDSRPPPRRADPAGVSRPSAPGGRPSSPSPRMSPPPARVSPPPPAAQVSPPPDRSSSAPSSSNSDSDRNTRDR